MVNENPRNSFEEIEDLTVPKAEKLKLKILAEIVQAIRSLRGK